MSTIFTEEELARARAKAAAAKGNGADDGEPLPLFPPLPAAEPYPIDALGPILSLAAKAVANSVQVPPPMAAQSVLATASLAACPHADVAMPYGQPRPLSLYLATVATSGERKTTSDNEATRPVQRREKALREQYDAAMKTYRIYSAAWNAERKKIEAKSAIGLSERRELLAAIGDEPMKPLYPLLLTTDPTIEGLTKNWPNCHAALGVFTTEGGAFTAGHGMNEDNRLKTAAMLSLLWDGKTMDRIRAPEILILPGRRLAMHLMVQPHAAGAFLSNGTLRDQGLLSRILVAYPESIVGTRKFKEQTYQDIQTIRSYSDKLLSMLETPPGFAEGKRNELNPRALPLSKGAFDVWREFYDHIESQSDGGLASVKDFALKIAEHAARMAGIITIVGGIDAKEISAKTMSAAGKLAQWYLTEAVRLQQAGMIDPALLPAEALLEWMQAQPEAKVSFREILQFGPNTTRTKAAAERAIAILRSHNWVTELSARPYVLQAVKA